MSQSSSFLFLDSAEPHRDRTRAILREHPEIRQLVGKNPWTGLIVAVMVTAQFGIAWFVSDKPWWIAVVVGYFVGAFIGHGLFVLMHDTSHNLLYKKRWLNNVFGILCCAPSLTPSSSPFQRYHLKHHSFQGIHELDGDLPSNWEVKLVGNGTIRKAIWLMFFPLIMSLRPPRLKEVKHFDRWVAANWIAAALIDVMVVMTLGWMALLYLACAMMFSLGLHPVGGRWIQEHYVFNPPQETYSYYGPMNRFAFNVGYHNEHHDFPAIPWNRLPDIKRIAPEYYEGLHYHMSWGRLVLRFLLDPAIGLYSRVERTSRMSAAVPKPERKAQPA